MIKDINTILNLQVEKYQVLDYGSIKFHWVIWVFSILFFLPLTIVMILLKICIKRYTVVLYNKDNEVVYTGIIDNGTLTYLKGSKLELPKHSKL